MSEMTNQTKDAVKGADTAAAAEAAAEAADADEASVAVYEDSAEDGTKDRKRARDGEPSKKQKLTTTTTDTPVTRSLAVAEAAADETTTTDIPVTRSFVSHVPYLYNCPPSRPTNLHLGTPNYGDNPPAEARNIMQLVLDHLNHEYNGRALANPLLPNVVWDFAGGLHIHAFVHNGVWCHINFRAKVVTDKPSSGIGKRGPYLIFGELRRIRKQEAFEVVTCQNLGPVEFAVPRLNGCKACDMAPHRDALMHGIKGFEVGHTLGFEG